MASSSVTCLLLSKSCLAQICSSLLCRSSSTARIVRSVSRYSLITSCLSMNCNTWTSSKGCTTHSVDKALERVDTPRMRENVLALASLRSKHSC
uniref:Secreted protein n=1 Tax=Rhipicephalus zambeziensis TaxID=60191 RepID=A0A224Y6I5_9ACAR